MYRTLVEEIECCGGKDLLDIGCENSNLFGLLPESNYRLCGIDHSNNMIAQAKETYGKLAELTVADAEKIPFGVRIKAPERLWVLGGRIPNTVFPYKS